MRENWQASLSMREQPRRRYQEKRGVHKMAEANKAFAHYRF
jgi:hypothetical protein